MREGVTSPWYRMEQRSAINRKGFAAKSWLEYLMGRADIIRDGERAK